LREFLSDGLTETLSAPLLALTTIAGNVRNTATALFVVVHVDALDQAGDFLGSHLGALKEYVFEREKLAEEAEARSYSLPSASATDKLLRYEAHVDRQLSRTMDQLERLQRRRKGENVPPPLNINLGRRS
jgi:hypothetical protein